MCTPDNFARFAASNAVEWKLSLALSISVDLNVDSKINRSQFLKNLHNSSVGLVSPEMPIFLPGRNGPTMVLEGINLSLNVMFSPFCNV